MAIGKRLSDPLQVVSVTCDTAIDKEKTPILDYAESRDKSVLVALPGSVLTFFTLAPLSPDHAALCRSYTSPMAELTAFQIACTACSDPSVLAPDAWQMVGQNRQIKSQALRDIPDQLWQELGAVALRLGTLTAGEERRFALPGGLPVTRMPRRSTTAKSADNSGPETPEQ